MKRTTILATIFSVFGFSANAEPYRIMQAPPGAMPAYEAVTITRSMGLDPLGGPVWRDGRYVVLATDGDGREMRVVLDAGTGQVIAVRPVAATYYEGYGPRGPYFGPGRVVREDDEYMPPRPRVGIHTPPSTTSVQKPAMQTASKPQAAPALASVAPTQKTAPKPSDSVRKHETPPQTTAAVTPPTSPEKKTIRKIEIDRKPQDTNEAPQTSAASTNPAQTNGASGNAAQGNTPANAPESEQKPATKYNMPVNPLL